MRVVEYRHIKPKYAFCTGCGTILEFTKAESRMSIITLSKGLQNNGKDYSITCPCCGRAIYDKDWKDSVEEC